MTQMRHMTHNLGAVNKSRVKVANPGHFIIPIDVAKKEFNDIGECIAMLNPVSDEDCFTPEGNIEPFLRKLINSQ